MKSPAQILRTIERRVRSNQTGQYFINGAPGTGKSYFLQTLNRHLHEALEHGVVFGPFTIDDNQTETYCNWIIDELYEACYIDERPEHSNNLVDVWRGLSSQVAARNRHLVILIDLSSTDMSEQATFFSALRALESSNSLRNFGLYHVVTGHWRHHHLKHYYRSRRLSFPYTIGNNYDIWEGVQVNQVEAMLSERCVHRHLYAGTLHEVFGGHAGAIQEVLAHSTVSRETFNLVKLLEATQDIAQQGNTARRLVTIWQQLSKSELQLVRQLLINRRVYTRSQINRDVEHLRTCGLVSQKLVDTDSYISFRSWFTELVVRLHCAEIGIEDEQLSRIAVTNIAPEIHVLHAEAYRIIRDIELSIRNLVTLFLSTHQPEDVDLLEDWDVDLHEKVTYQRDKNGRNGIDTSLNPPLAYLTTYELQQLVENIGRRFNRENWSEIATMLNNVRHMRNAVMHNQLIDEQVLEKLGQLRQRIYSAM